MGKRIPLLFLAVICLAVVGFLYSFISNPTYVLLSVGVVALLFYVLNNFAKTGRFFKRDRSARKYKQAVKQSRSLDRKSGKTARRAHPFRVIEGSKGKRNDNPNDTDSNMYH